MASAENIKNESNAQWLIEMLDEVRQTENEVEERVVDDTADLNSLCGHFTDLGVTDSTRILDKHIYVVRKQDFSAGGYEVTMRRRRTGSAPLPSSDNAGEPDRAAENEDRAARRAAREIRHHVKNIGANRMLTLTRRETGTDIWSLDEWKSACESFIRSLKRKNSGMEYVGVWERKSRRWHLHLAINRHVDIVAARQSWISIAGDGAVNVSHISRCGRYVRMARIASYLAKQLRADWSAFPKHARHYMVSRRQLPQAEVSIIAAPTYHEALNILTKRLGLSMAAIAKHRRCVCEFVDSAGERGIWLTFDPVLAGP